MSGKWRARDLNPVHVVLDEIALEGLDGITLEALETRLKRRWDPIQNKNQSPLFTTNSGSLKIWSFLWGVIRDQNEIEVFTLPEPRLPLVVFDRFVHIDSELGMIIEPDVLPIDIYPFHLVDDGETKGSCSTYKARVEVTKAAKAIEDVDELTQKFGGQGRIAFVASAWARSRALMGLNTDPLLIQTITGMQWAILERIGRARELGEVTQGRMSLQFTKENAKTLFYHRKALIKANLIRKQIHYQKTKGQNYQGSLFHLSRFFVERRSKALILIHSLIKYLKERPKNMAPYDEVKSYLNIGTSVKKLFKHAVFQRFVRGDVKIPFRLLYPKASDNQWKCKNKTQNDEGATQDKEKQLRVVQLINPEVDPELVWQDGRDEGLDDEDDDCNAGFLDQSMWKLTRTLMHQAYSLLEENGPNGLSQQELGQKMGLGKLESRTICRNLERRNLVGVILQDQGRQRTTKFVAKKFEHLSVASQDLEKEKKKMAHLKSQNNVPATPPTKPRRRSAGNKAQPAKVEAPPEDQSPKEDGMGGTNVEISLGTTHIKIPGKKSPMKEPRNQRKKEEQGLTYRQMRRVNTIIETVRQYKVIDDPTKLYKIIQENELNEGFEDRMDKKSLLRLLVKLHEEGQIKNIVVKMNAGDKSKTIHFVCEPNITENHTVVQSAVEQAKMKFNITPKQIKQEAKPVLPGNEDFVGDSIGESVQAIHELNETSKASQENPKASYNPRYATAYGLKPKFVRMRELHQFLFYLTHDFNGQSKAMELGEVEKKLVGKFGATLLDDQLREDLQGVGIYSHQMDWKMFVPPLPDHEGWTKGWCLMCDVLLRLPLSIFVQLVNITTFIEGLSELLEHPIRRHFPVRYLSTPMRNKLLARRKYIFTVHEVATRLCYIGVLQFGPQKLKEKDQVFLYLNKQASLIDTTACSPSYHRVSYLEGVEYPTKRYGFSKWEEAEKYWFDMYDICMNTPLGSSTSVQGEEIILEKMDKKPALLVAQSPRKCIEAINSDDGEIPGDHLGAAGLDSSMFAHLKRNWSWTSSSGTRPRMDPSQQTDKKYPFPSTLKAPKLSVNFAESSTPNPRKATKRRKPGDMGKGKAKVKSEPVTPKITPAVRAKTHVIKRVIKARAKTAERKPYYDEVDKAALRLMRKLRVDWSAQEDSYLLLCKVAGLYLCQNSRNQMVQYVWVRDLLHRHFAESLNKTSHACQRRLNYMMKNPTTANNVTLFLADLQQDTEISSRYVVPMNGTLSKEDNEARLLRDFEPLVNELVGKYRNSASDKNSLVLPDTMEELNAKFSILTPTVNMGGVGESSNQFSDPADVSDIRASVINTLITSSLCCATDKMNVAFQLFKIYQQYPDSLIRRVMSKLRSDKMVSLKKHFNKSRLKHGNFLPLNASPYQLSVSFAHKFLNRYQHDIYEQSWMMTRKILENEVIGQRGTEVVINQEGGFASAIVGMMSKSWLSFRTEVPEQLVVLDPNLSLVDHQYVRILQRYKELLKISGSADLEAAEGMDANPFQDESGPSCSSPSTGSKATPRKDLTVTDLFRKVNSEQGSSSAKRSHGDVSESGVDSSPKRLKPADKGEAVKGRESEIVFREAEASSSCPAVDDVSNARVAKSASRIALYMMREEIKDATNPNLQHSHDFFVISSCQIMVKIRALAQEQEEMVAFGGLNVPKSLLPGDSDAAKGILHQFGVGLNGMATRSTTKLNRSCIPANSTTLEAISERLTDPIDVANLVQMHAFIEAKLEFGVSAQALRGLELNPEGSMSKEDCLRLLLDHQIVLFLGVVETVFVLRCHSQPWLLRSYRTTRVNFREKHDLGTGSLLNTETQKTVEIHKGKVAEESNALAETTEKINWGKVEEIDIRLRPWLRIDGTLNRRVLDRLLGAVLGQIMQYPGETLAMIFRRFSPALQPVQIKDLLEILLKLDCIQVAKLVRTGRKVLFAPKPIVTIENASILLDPDEDVFVESTVDAIVKLGQFIGDKQYSVDFVGHCSCHPEKRL
eukprot:maker-scaffold493_size155937-snap-gene-0.21 protein:Tk11852 transcript:maker-scaffold493_size155937-snap-gene-0.21-mRNA-1 annotation:"general transcription factor 3c polypeptide 1"